MGTIRIFMTPVFDDNGNRMSFNDQRKLMIELDKFTQASKLSLLLNIQSIEKQLPNEVTEYLFQ